MQAKIVDQSVKFSIGFISVGMLRMKYEEWINERCLVINIGDRHTTWKSER